MTQGGVWTATALPVYEPFAVEFKPWVIANVAMIELAVDTLMRPVKRGR